MDIFIIEDDQSLSNEIKLALSKWGYSVGQVNDFENITIKDYFTIIKP